MAHSTKPRVDQMGPSSADDVPGKPLTMGSKMTDFGMKLVGNFAPITSMIHEHLCGFHYYRYSVERDLRLRPEFFVRLTLHLSLRPDGPLG